MLHKAVLHRKHHKGQILMGRLVSDDIQLAIDVHKNVSGELKGPTDIPSLPPSGKNHAMFLLVRPLRPQVSCTFDVCLLLSLPIIFIADFQLSRFC